MRLRSLAFLLFLVPLVARAQYQDCRVNFPGVDPNVACIQLSGSNLRDPNGNKLNNGRFVMTVTNSTGTPVSYTPQGGSSSSLTFIGHVVNGAVQNIGGYPFTILNTLNATPSGLVFHFQLESTDGLTIYQDYPLWNLTSTTGGSSLDSFVALAGTTISGMGYPRTRLSPTAKYNQTDAPFGAKPWIGSNLWRTDKSNQWTQNPSSDPNCTQGQAIVSPYSGPTYCILPENAYALPGEGFTNPSPTIPGPVMIDPLAASGGGNPGAPPFSMQFANAAGTGFQGSAQLLYDPATETLTDKANMVINALSSTPRAIYDPMDTKYLGGLAAAIAGSSGFTPAQVLQKVADYGECQNLMGLTQYHTVSIPLPSGIIIPIGQVLLWGGEAMGGDGPVTGPTLQSNDSTKFMIAHHNAGDTITCSNGTTYNPQPAGAGGTYIHDIAIGGMGPVNTDTNIGVLMNCESCALVNIRGASNAFGGPAVMSNGTSVFMDHIGFPGSQVKGCATYNGGIRPISSFTLGGQVCGSVQDQSGDGGDFDVYATDGQAFNVNHAPGSCYPSCAAMVLSGNGEDAGHLFLQLSSQGLIIGGFNQKIDKVRIDWTSREGIRFVGGGATATITDTIIDSACTDKALRTNYLAGIGTLCFGATVPNSSRAVFDDFALGNNVGIFDQAYVQAWVNDQNNSGSGVSSSYKFGAYQGNADNTTANDLLMTVNGASKISPMVYFPDRNVEVASNTTPNVSGITSITLVSGQTVTNFKNGINGQHLFVQGSGIVQQNANIQNQNLLDNSVTSANGYFPLLEYVYGNGLWRQIAGPANQTPNHVNYFGNPTPSDPSLNEVYGDTRSRRVPAFSILADMQLHGPAAGSGQACFEQKASFTDGSYVVSDLQCSSVELTTQTPGEIFTTLLPQAVTDLYLVSNTEANAIPIGKYPRHTSLWDGPTVVALGGDGTTAPPANENTTGLDINEAIRGPATAPSGSCTAGYGGLLVVSQDGHGTFCPIGGGTWTTKF